MKLLTKKPQMRLFTLICSLLVANEAVAADTTVSDVAGLRAALAQAAPGDTITLAAGTYRVDTKLRVDRDGEPGAPITLRAQPGALIEVNTPEGIKQSAAHWIFQDLHFKGVCAEDSQCEHALHIVADSDHTTVRDCVFQNFNAHIKGNGEERGEPAAFVYPDDVLIVGSEFYNDAPRQTSNPVTPIDVVGGRRWVVRANFIHDHAKAQGNKVSYAAFLKGNSRDGIFERNLIACELLHSGQVRLGLSLGGGGTSPDRICEEGSCDPEHQGGIIRNNLIVNCPADVGIYLNEAANTRIEHNTLYNTTGIDVRFASSDAIVLDNLLSGRARVRDGGSITMSAGNLEQVSAATFGQWFVDPAMLDFSLLSASMVVDSASQMSQTLEDYCGNPRTPPLDVGAIEYTTPSPCDTSTTHPPLPDMGHEDMGHEDMGHEDMGHEDMGAASPDMRAWQDLGLQDMRPTSSPPDMSPSLDMGASSPDMRPDMTPPPYTTQPVDSDGCSSTAGSRPCPPLGVLLVLGVCGVGIMRRRGVA